MPEMDGVAMTGRVPGVAHARDLLSPTGRRGDLPRLEAGARGYLLKKDTLGDDMLKAIRSVNGDQRYIRPPSRRSGQRMHRPS